jgi:glycogen debranching enzyme
MKEMKLHNRYGYGQLFCFSGLDGETSRNDDFVAMMMDEPITLRFHFDKTVTLRIPLKENAKFNAVTGDMLDGEDFFVAFLDRNTIVGKSLEKPVVLAEDERVLDCDFYLSTEEKNGVHYFCFSYKGRGQVCDEMQLNALKTARYAYFESLPKCKEEKYEKLYYKCLSINKENVYSPEGKIPCRWTTPDRVPHRFMWLWDSAFHAMAFAQYNVEMAKNCIRAVLSLQREDGFISHMMSPQGRISEITQPQVLAWGVWTVYQKDKDKEFLRECVPALSKFLLWTMKNRDKNGNGLLEWFTEPDYTECKCGESGLDNSPRFDYDIELDAIDFSTWLCNDAKYLALIYGELGDSENTEYFYSIYNNVKEKINTLLWSEEDGLYYDRLFDGRLTKFATPSSFLPMFAGICSQAQADKMVKVLLDENRFWTEMPVPSIPRDNEYYDIDMWRGCSWLNINYFIILGLRKYGYADIAEELRARTLASVSKWYKETGNIFEFYDADNKVNPFHLKRKGEQPEQPDYKVHVHSITDYNWSACFTQLLIQNDMM